MGARQAGVPDLKLARLARDRDALLRARELATAILAADPRLDSAGERAAASRGRRRVRPRARLAAQSLTRPSPRRPVYCGHAHAGTHRLPRQHRLRRLRGDGRRPQALPGGGDLARRRGQPQRARVPGAVRRPDPGRRPGRRRTRQRQATHPRRHRARQPDRRPRRPLRSARTSRSWPSITTRWAATCRPSSTPTTSSARVTARW